MKPPINLILTLMSLCVGGIIGLQLFWNYQNYQLTVRTFEQQINALLHTAVEQEIGLRHQQLVNQFKGWLADTALITITCDTRSRDSSTVFYIQDRSPAKADDKPLTLGITYFKEKLRHITPAAKAVVIQHVGERILKGDLQKGIVYYYTPGLGDRLQRAFTQSQVNLDTLAALYQRGLLAAEIPASFTLGPTQGAKAVYRTRPVNTDLRRPYQQALVQAGFEPPDRYFLKTMKWVLLSTLLLVAVTLLCFAYTAKTLLSQRTLALLKDQFINNMTHELNTPLASIQLTTEALRTFDYPPQVRQDYLAIIGYQTQKLTQLTAQVLSANRLLANPEEDWQRLELHALLTQAINELAIRYPQQGDRIHYFPLATPVWLRGEGLSLVNVFTNLLDNALKYALPPAQVTVSLVLHQKYVDIVIADTGPGIPPEYTHQVFEPFFRVPTGNRHDVKGYGLGLSYVHQVMGQHRGSVRVEGNKPSGCLFTVQLPLTGGKS